MSGSWNTSWRTSRTWSTSERPGIRAQATGVIRLLHPFPSLLDGVVTAALASVAGAGAPTSVLLGLSMFCLQATIGSVNDIADVERDRANKPGKPLPRGVIGLPVAKLLAATGLVLGLAGSAVVRRPLVVIALAGVGLGLAYDLRLKAGPWSWLPFALGIGLLPIYAWFGATGQIPAVFVVLVPLAVLGGAALALANQLADDERDLASGLHTAVRALGRRRAWRLSALLEATVAVIALGTLVVNHASLLSIGAADIAIGLMAIGLELGRSLRAELRERAWELQAVGLGILALAWVAGLAGRGLVSA